MLKISPSKINATTVGIIDTEGDSRYTMPGRIDVEVTHTLRKEQVEQMIRMAAQKYGKEFVLDAVGCKNSSERGFMVSVDGTQAPRKTHHTFAQAEQEARRLVETLKAPKTVRVLEVKKVLSSKVIEKVVIEGV